MSRKTGVISLIAAGAGAIALGAMTGSAAAAPAKAKLLTAVINILDQQSPLLDDNGAPIVDPDTGLPETLDDTSVTIDATFLGDILALTSPAPAPAPAPAPQLQAPAGATLTIGVEPGGFCAALAAQGNGGTASPDLMRLRETRPFIIPIAQIRALKGLPASDVFEGFAGRQALAVDAEAATPLLALPPGSTFETEGPDLFDGLPWANLTITPGLLILPGALKLQGVTDLTELLGPPKLTVDLAIEVQAPVTLKALAAKPAQDPGLICITVPAGLTIEQLPGVNQNRF